MCVAPLVNSIFGGGKLRHLAPPGHYKPQAPAPTVKNAQRAPEYVEPEKLKDELGDDEKIETKKKKALEIKKVKEGVKEFGALDAKTMPTAPEGGVNVPS